MNLNKYLLQISQRYFAVIYRSSPSLCSGKSNENIIIRKCIIRQQLVLDRPVSASSNSPSKDLPRRLRPFCSTIQYYFCAPCCISFLLHVAAKLLCIVLLSRQPVLLSTLPKFLHPFYCQKGCTRHISIHTTIYCGQKLTCANVQ